MIYNLNSSCVSELIDRSRTGNYGEDFYVDYMNCSCCGNPITEGDRYYDIGGCMYCMDCETEADELILETVRDDYIYEL